MAIQTHWIELISSHAFWVSYVSAGVNYHGCPSLQADAQQLRKGPNCAVTLTFAFPDAHALQMSISDGEHHLEHLDDNYDRPQEIGRMDSHRMNDLFRWEEFRSVTRQLAVSCGPEWAVELLFSFYVAVTPDIVDEHAAMLQRCLELSKVFSGSEIEHILSSRRWAMRQDFQWTHRSALGWVAGGNDAICSMRSTSVDADEEFEFARFGRFLAALDREVVPGAGLS